MKTAKMSITGMMLLSALVSTQGFAQTIPDGYREGREGAIEGTFNTAMSPGAKPYQDRASDLENMAYGLAKLSNEDPVHQSEQIYLLENQIIRLNLDIANAPQGVMTAFERASLISLTARTYQIARMHAERIFEDMIRFIDKAIPGPSGKQNRTEISDTESMYDANYRVDQDLTQAERDARYQTHLAAFEKKGGSLSEIKVLNSAEFKTFKAYTRVEYVWLLDGKIMVTEGNAGHVLLAKGRPVKAAGQMIFLKDNNGHLSLLVVSNSSGNYKPDMMSIEKLAEKLQKELKVSQDLTIITKGEPMSTQAVKVYLKGEGVDPTVIKNKLDDIEARAVAIRNPQDFFGSAKCGLAFGK